MNIKYILTIVLVVVCKFTFSQMNDCSDPIYYGCASSNFIFSSVGDDFDDFPTGSVSSGCLATGDNQLIYMVLYANSAGLLEWSVQGSGGTGFMDWAIWPFDPNTTCAGLSNGTLAPLACCWNSSSDGFSGMLSPANPLAIAHPGNTQPPILLAPGQSVLLGISNFSGSLDGQNITLTFNNPSLISCNPTANDETICLGETALININAPAALLNPTFNWLETNGVGNPTGGTNVPVSPLVTSTYHVVVSDITSVPPFIDTAVLTITVVDPPIPNAGLNDTICLGSTLQLNGTISNATDTYSWTYLATGITPTPIVNFAPNITTLNPTVTIDQPGIYQFVLSETNVTCGTITDTVQIFVSNIVQNVITTDPTCATATDGIITINSNNAVLYSFDNGVTWGNTNTLNTFIAGTYNVCSKNAEGCQVCSSVTLIDPPAVTISASNDTLICQNGTAILSASATGGINYLYHWSQTPSTGNIQTVNPINTTTYTVFVENENGCISPTEQIVVTLKLPISGTITPDLSICPGYPTNITATASDGNGAPYNFTWSTTDNSVGNSSTIEVNPLVNTTYTVVISDACESTPLNLSTTVSLFPVPDPHFSIDNDSICEKAIFTIRNTTDPNFVGHLKWFISDGEVYNDQEVINTAPLNNGYYDVKLIVTSQNGCIDSINVLSCLISMPKPIPSFSYSPNPVKVFDTDVVFTNVSENSDSYEWFIDGGSPSYANSKEAHTHYPEGVAASYEVTLIATSDFGCIDSSVNYVIVLPVVTLFAPNAFTPNNDEFNQSWRVYIDGIDPFNFNLKVYDRWGEIIWESNDPEDSWDGTYNGRKAIDGTYNWLIETKDKFNDEKYQFNGSFSLIK